jgi:hypothetical protein
VVSPNPPNVLRHESSSRSESSSGRTSAILSGPPVELLGLPSTATIDKAFAIREKLAARVSLQTISGMRATVSSAFAFVTSIITNK